MNRSALSILLAVAVAFASPMWCCCAIAVAADSLLGVAQCSTAAASCAGTAAPKRTCCADDADEESPCRCSHRPSELLALDTAGKPSLPKIDRVAVAAVGDDSASEITIRHSGVPFACERNHPPPRTLLVQRCLLLL